jgi:hypothetical protein
MSEGKKEIEFESARLFVDEYSYVTGIKMNLVAGGERPDFICEKRGRRYGLELVRAMRNPELRRWEALLSGEDHVHGLDAAILVQNVAYKKDVKRASPGWRYSKSTILVIELIASDGEEMSQYLDTQLMDEMCRTGFCEIWVSDFSKIEPYGTVQLIGVKPKRWRGVHRHQFQGLKPYD